MEKATLFVLCILALSVSCGTTAPEYVWVPGPGFQAKVEVSWSAGLESARVGEWLPLHADRETGPWKQVAYRDLEAGTQWQTQPPPGSERGVEGNVTWHVEPSGKAEFNLPTTLDLFTRRVRFSEPGTYSLWATSHDWRGGTVSSNRLTITINP